MRIMLRFSGLPLLVIVGAVGTLGLGPQVWAAGKAQQITLVLTEFKFEPSTIHLKVGEQVVLTLKNGGAVKHEWSVGQELVNTAQQKGFHRDLLAILKPQVTGRAYELERVRATARENEKSAEGETAEMLSTDVEVEPHGVAVLRFTVPASAKGTWQFGCFETGHYEAGMKGILVID